MRPVPLAVWLLVLALHAPAFGASIATPSQFLKMEIGADRVLADYRQIESYFRHLDAASPRVQVENLGKTTLGADLLMAVISSEANLGRLAELKELARKLSDPRGLSDAEIEGLVERGRAVVLVTCNIHSTEIGASQMAMEWAHALASAEDAETRRRLEEVVLLLVPSLNPDGQIMETEWYRKWLGTKYEGGRMPWLYHHYTGHDDNRDWYMLTQKETKAMSRAVYHEWYPQVWLDEHQMGNAGPRIFVPPYSEPVDTDIHPLVWREVNLIGSNMALRLEQAGKAGIIYGYAFDAYWPGGTKNTAWYKNISGLLTEVASARMASPIRIEPNELAGGRKGLVEYVPQVNFPNPWKGGIWRLRDIMDYERIASDALLESCADRRRDLLRNMAMRARAAIALGAKGEAYRIPLAQRETATALKLAALLDEHHVEVFDDGDGALWAPLAQPYGRFVREMLEAQRYPEVKLVEGREIVRPYDVSAWSLPMMMGVTVEKGAMPRETARWRPEQARASVPRGAMALARGVEANRALNAAVRSGGRVTIAREEVARGDARWPAGTAFLDGVAAVAAGRHLASGVVLQPLDEMPTQRAGVKGRGSEPDVTGPVAVLKAPRVGLYKPWAASMDEGWTRFLLEQYGFAPVTLDNATIQKGGLRGRFDCIVIPDVSKEVIATGKPRRDDGAMAYFVELPPGYGGGLDAAGAKALKEFVGAGGTLVAMAASSDYVIEQFNIPVNNVLARVRPDEFGAPGTLLRAKVANTHPVTWGLPAEMALFVDKPIAFQTSPPAMEMDRAVLATYPDHADEVRMSGWIRGEERLVRRAAAVATTWGKGRLVLLGFRPQHRAQTDATFPFLFNSIWWSVMP